MGKGYEQAKEKFQMAKNMWKYVPTLVFREIQIKTTMKYIFYLYDGVRFPFRTEKLFLLLRVWVADNSQLIPSPRMFLSQRERSWPRLCPLPELDSWCEIQKSNSASRLNNSKGLFSREPNPQHSMCEPVWA